MKKNILILGGAGFLGSAICETLKSENILVYDNLLTGKKSFIEAFAKFIEGDINDSIKLARAIVSFKPDVIIHLAAIHHIPTCDQNPIEAERVNYIGTHTILRLLEENNFSGKFLFASTGAVYSQNLSGELFEDSLLDPEGIYPLGKFSSEKLIHIMANKINYEYCIMRLFNLVGKNETNSHLVPDLLSRLKDAENFLAHGNLSPLRDYLHVDDAAEAIKLWIEHEGNTSNIFNLSSGNEYSVKEVINISLAVTEKELELKEDKKFLRKNDRKEQHANIDLIRKELNWRPRRDLKMAVSELWSQIKSE